jgi:hypothetical protein
VIAASAAAVRTPAVRAAELAAVSLRLYEAGGKTIRLPLAPEFGLIVILREVLGTAGSSSVVVPSTKELKELAQLRDGAAEVAQALLEMILQQHQQVSNHTKVCACTKSQRSSNQARKRMSPCSWFCVGGGLLLHCAIA